MKENARKVSYQKEQVMFETNNSNQIGVMVRTAAAPPPTAVVLARATVTPTLSAWKASPVE